MYKRDQQQTIIQKSGNTIMKNKISEPKTDRIPIAKQPLIQQQILTRQFATNLAQTTEVQFIIKCGQTQPKDRVALVGNIPGLGEWNPELCVFLDTDPQTFPFWKKTLNLPRDTKIEYKYIIVSQQHVIQFDAPINQIAQGQPITQFRPPQVVSVLWEEFGFQNNRKLNTFDKSQIIMHEIFNSRKVIEEFVDEVSNQIHPLYKKSQSSQQEEQSVSKQAPILVPNIAMPQVQPVQKKQQIIPTHNAKILAIQENQVIQPKLEQQEEQKIKPPHIKIPIDNTHEQSAQKKVENSELPDIKEEDEERQASSRRIKDPIAQNKINPIKPASPMVIQKEKQNDGNQKQITNQKKQKDDFIVQPQIQLDKTEPIITASQLLPYEVVRNQKDGSLSIQKCIYNPAMLYATLEHMKQKGQFNFHWVGLVTTANELSDQEQEQLKKLYQAKQMYPIFVTYDDIQNFLLFYENILRPLFHNFKDIRDMRNDFLKYWKDYLAINLKFAQKILEIRNILNGCKTIWIHSNYLLMVPLYVKKQFEKANIGMFFHSPFPSSAHFRSHKYRFEILKSLLHCDLVAFHLFMFARNFFKSCNRICGFEIEFRRGGFLGINFHGKHVMIRVSHIGIEESFLEELINSKKFKTFEKKFNNEMKIIGSQLRENQIQSEINSISPLNEKIKGNLGQGNDSSKPIIMASIDDSYHPISGLKNKLLSYQLFLQKYPSYQNRIVLIQFVSLNMKLYDSQQINVINNTRKKILQIQDEIHNEFGRQCLIIQETNPSLEKRLALWTAADIILCSQLKDGLCLPILEYVKCKVMADKLKHSTMISSEFAGCNEGMRGVLVYNPFSATEFLETMDKALSLTSEEREERMKQAYQYVKRNSVTKWTEEFLKDLKLAYQPVQVSYYLGLNFNTSRGKKNINRLMQEKSGLKKLNIDECCGNLLKAQKCAIFLDIECLPHLQFSKHSIPTNEVIEQLYGLLIDNRNTVIIMGSNSREELEDWFGRNVGSNGNNFWLVAESGYLYRPGNKEGWHKLTELNDLSWIDKVKKIMQAYTDNIDGSFIEVRQSCIVWNYRNAEMEHGNMFIHDLYSQIEKTIKGTQTEIIYGNGYLEVKPLGIEKKKLINLLLQKISQNSLIDFLFYMGIDSSDEPVFELLKSENVRSKYLNSSLQSYICSLEKKPSEADYYIEEIDTVRILLEKMQTEIKKRKKIRSYSDLTVLKATHNPFSVNKLQGKKTESIANLQQYFNSQIGLNDKSVFGIDSQISSFIPKRNGKNTQNMFGEYNSTKIIEEESLCSSHDQSYGNKIKPDNKNKFGSVEINPNKVKILTEDKSSSYKRDQQKTSSQNKKSDNNDEIPSSSLQKGNQKSSGFKSSDPSIVNKLKKIKILNRSQSPQNSGSDRLECMSSDKQDNLFFKPPDLNSMKKNIHGVTGALHQSLASFQRKSINVGTYGSDMKLNLDENKHDDKPLSFEKDNFLHSNEPQVNLQGSHNISIESNRENNMKKNRSLDSNDESQPNILKKISSMPQKQMSESKLSQNKDKSVTILQNVLNQKFQHILQNQSQTQPNQNQQMAVSASKSPILVQQNEDKNKIENKEKNRMKKKLMQDDEEDDDDPELEFMKE